MDTEALRDALQAGEGPTIVCAQTGEVNTGAFDDFDVEHTCECARRFAERIVELDGVELLNDVVLNQVLFRFDSDQRTDDVLRAVQDSGDVWMSGTAWDGRRAIRVSVSNWQTGEDEIDLALDSFRRASRHARQVSRR